MKDIDEIIAALTTVDSDALDGPLNFPALDVRSKNDEVVISGNKTGLQHLALQLLRIANSGVVGAHYHLDTVSIANVAETDVIFTLASTLE